MEIIHLGLYRPTYGNRSVICRCDRARTQAWWVVAQRTYSDITGVSVLSGACSLLPGSWFPFALPITRVADNDLPGAHISRSHAAVASSFRVAIQSDEAMRRRPAKHPPDLRHPRFLVAPPITQTQRVNPLKSSSLIHKKAFVPKPILFFSSEEWPNAIALMFLHWVVHLRIPISGLPLSCKWLFSLYETFDRMLMFILLSINWQIMLGGQPQTASACRWRKCNRCQYLQ